MRIAVLALLPACGFSAHVLGAEPEIDEIDSGVVEQHSDHCTQPGLKLCLDFEGPTWAREPFGTSVSSTNVIQMDRAGEQAAQFRPDSSLWFAENDNLALQRLTIEMWMRPTQPAPGTGDKQSGLFDYSLQYWMVFEQGDHIECWIGGQDQADSLAMSLNAWHHVACTYDGQKLRTYVDGKLQGCKDTSRTVGTLGALGGAIGSNVAAANSVKNRFVGELDNVHVFGSALTGQEICTLSGNTDCSNECP